MLLRDVLDLPESAGAEDFVLRLTEKSATTCGTLWRVYVAVADIRDARRRQIAGNAYEVGVDRVSGVSRRRWLARTGRSRRHVGPRRRCGQLNSA